MNLTQAALNATSPLLSHFSHRPSREYEEDHGLIKVIGLVPLCSGVKDASLGVEIGKLRDVAGFNLDLLTYGLSLMALS